MATALHKPVTRRVEFNGRVWLLTMSPATPERRWDGIAIRPKGTRRGGPSEYLVPVESFLLFAAERTRQVRIRERKALRKAKKFGA